VISWIVSLSERSSTIKESFAFVDYSGAHVAGYFSNKALQEILAEVKASAKKK
jgi:hypothetical protein